VVSAPFPCITTSRTAAVVSTPISAGRNVWCMAFWAQPQIFHVTAFGHSSGRWIVGVPLPGQPGVVGHTPALTEAATLAVTGGTEYVTSVSCQVSGKSGHHSLPLMVPAAIMDTAWAAQPDGLLASVGKVARQLAQILCWMPPGLDEVVLRVL